MTLVMTPDQIVPIVASDIVQPYIRKEEDSLQGQHSSGVREPNLSDVEQLIVTILAADGDWVLVDRNRASREYNDSSARHIALKRRGFEVTSRAVQGVRNYWARWPHAEVPSPLVPSCSSDDKNTAYGNLPG